MKCSIQRTLILVHTVHIDESTWSHRVQTLHESSQGSDLIRSIVPNNISMTSLTCNICCIWNAVSVEMSLLSSCCDIHEFNPTRFFTCSIRSQFCQIICCAVYRVSSTIWTLFCSIVRTTVTIENHSKNTSCRRNTSENDNFQVFFCDKREIDTCCDKSPSQSSRTIVRNVQCCLIWWSCWKLESVCCSVSNIIFSTVCACHSSGNRTCWPNCDFVSILQSVCSRSESVCCVISSKCSSCCWSIYTSRSNQADSTTKNTTDCIDTPHNNWSDCTRNCRHNSKSCIISIPRRSWNLNHTWRINLNIICRVVCHCYSTTCILSFCASYPKHTRTDSDIQSSCSIDFQTVWTFWIEIIKVRIDLLQSCCRNIVTWWPVCWILSWHKIRIWEMIKKTIMRLLLSHLLSKFLLLT